MFLHSEAAHVNASQAQWDPMTGQWVSMGPLMAMMQQQQQQQPQLQHPGLTPHTMVGYNLQPPPGGLGPMPVPPAAAKPPDAAPPANATPEPQPSGRITLTQTFSWQVCANL